MSFGTKTCLQAEPKALTDAALRRPLEETDPPSAATASTTATVLDVVQVMRKNGTPAVLLCDPETGALRGIFTERDLVRIAHLDPDFVWMPIRNFMTPNPIALGPWDSIGYALNRMTVDGFRHIPIVDLDGRPSGIVSRAYLLKHLSRHLGLHGESGQPADEQRLPAWRLHERLKSAS